MRQTADIKELTAWRHEVKYLVPVWKLQLLDRAAAVSGIYLTTRYRDRWVHSVYYDDPGFNAYYLHLDGVSSRQKVRLRWYDGNTDSVQLEIKERLDVIGRKQKYRMYGRLLEDILAKPLHYTVQEYPEMSSMLPDVSKQMPVARISYLRSYLAPSSGSFTLTIDRKVGYSPGRSARRPLSSGTSDAIVEIKFDKEIPAEARKFLQHFPVRRTKNSKYINAVEFLRLV